MARKRRGIPVHGWALIDKPPATGSTEVVSRVRRYFNAQKAGHGGTLDPLATGLLPIALGEATKTVAYALDGDKSYQFTARFGIATDTEDAEGAVVDTHEHRPDTATIDAVLPAFTGPLDQIPPAYSALKVAGVRSYTRARGGEEVSLPPRRVMVHTLELIDRPDRDHAIFRVVCEKGFYVRALARDLGLALGTLAHVSALRRTHVAGFSVDDAISLDALEGLEHCAALETHLHPIEAVLDDIPALPLSDAEAYRLRHGQSLSLLSRQDLERLDRLGNLSSRNGRDVLAMASGKPVALVRIEGAQVKPVRVLNLD